jgi:hypothetical protein
MDEPEPLVVTCRSCTSPVPTPFRLTSAVYELDVDESYDLTCPTCGTTASYTKADFHIPAAPATR